MTEAVFLRDICEHPGGDAPRLVFADWLEDNGQPERAEFIRLEMRLYHYSTLEAEGVTWDALFARRDALRDQQPHLGLPRSGWASEHRRGFVHSVTLTLAEFLQHVPALFSRHPIEEVWLSDATPLDDAGAASYFGGDADSPAEWWYWMRSDDGGARLPWEVPACLWEHLDGEDFCSEAAADAALSRACVAWGRQQAGLPPLEAT